MPEINRAAKPGLRSIFVTLSSLLSRAGLAARIGSLFGDTRRIHEILGYKRAPAYLDYKARYARQDIARALVDAYPDATWAQAPRIVEDGNADRETQLEAVWTALASRLSLFSALERADRLAQLGRYSVLILGLRGQSDLAQPAQPVRRQEDVLFLAPYSEEFVDIVQLEIRPEQEGFGRPLVYRLNTGRGTAEQVTAAQPSLVTNVHASRVIHVANNLLDDDVYGHPVLESVYDRLDDLLKIVGGSAEMFWVDAKRRFLLSLREGYDYGTEEEEAAFTTEVQAFVDEMKTFLRVKGVDVNSLSADIPDPKEHFNMLVTLLAAASGIPKRKLLGTEEGQLAGAQDERAWLQLIARRQTMHCEPRQLRPLIDRLIMLGALPQPVTPYCIEWPNLLALSAAEQADVASRLSTALSQYAGPGLGESIVPAEEYRERVLGFPPTPPGGFDLPEVPSEEEGDL